MKLSEEMTKLIALGQQYGERVEHTDSMVKVEFGYLPVLGPTAELLTCVTSRTGSTNKFFELIHIRPCFCYQNLRVYTAALVKLTEFTDILCAMGYKFEGIHG